MPQSSHRRSNTDRPTKLPVIAASLRESRFRNYKADGSYVDGVGPPGQSQLEIPRPANAVHITPICFVVPGSGTPQAGGDHWELRGSVGIRATVRLRAFIARVGRTKLAPSLEYRPTPTKLPVIAASLRGVPLPELQSRWELCGRRWPAWGSLTGSDLVGRPGLDPGTLGLKVLCSSG